MFRELKQSSTLRNRVFRNLTCDEQTKVQMCLDKIILEDLVEGDGDQCTTSPAALLALPAPEVETPGKSVVPVQNQAKQSLRRSLQFSPSSLGQIEETPAIFGKILAGKSSTGDQGKKPALTDADILQAAMDFVPPQVEGKKTKSGSKKKKEKKTASQKKAIQKKTVQKKESNDQKKKKKTGKPAKTDKTAKTAKTAIKKKPAQSCAAKRARSSVPKSPDYVIQEMPSMEDGYRNLYVSRHWHRANQLAKRCGLSLEDRKIRRRKAAEEAGKIWDSLHPN